MGQSSQVKAQSLANEANIRNVDATNDNQVKLMREQNQWNLEQWERENQYNSPEEQRKRLEAAGLNPLLIEGWSSGNATGPASSIQPPQLQTAHVEPEWSDPQIKANAFQQIAGAFKNFGDFSKSMSESGINSMQFGFVKDMALQGFNPETIKARTSLELYNQLVTSGKYQVPQIEAIIRGYMQRANFDAWAAEERRQMVDNLKAQYEGIKFTNKFNADKAPLELGKLFSEVRDIYLGTNIKANVAESQINLADKQGSLAAAQTGLVEEQTETQKQQTAIARFKAGLADMGINPDDKHLPFFMGLGMNLANGSVPAWKVSQLFQGISEAEHLGWNNLKKGDANLTIFQLEGEPSGPLGIYPVLNEQINNFEQTVKSWFTSPQKK